MPNKYFNIKGLTTDQVISSQKKYGPNVLNYKKEMSTVIGFDAPLWLIKKRNYLNQMRDKELF